MIFQGLFLVAGDDMKLSEAMRLGAMLHPQGFGQLMHGGRTCAMGAALAAIGHRMANLEDLDVETFQIVYREAPRCPACTSLRPGLTGHIIVYGMILHLNDGHHWTREQIAEWVAGIERQHETAEQALSHMVTT